MYGCVSTTSCDYFCEVKISMHMCVCSLAIVCVMEKRQIYCVCVTGQTMDGVLQGVCVCVCVELWY
jgi:hypothetical protein